MKDKKTKNLKEERVKEKKNKKNKKVLIAIIIVAISILMLAFFINKEGQIKTAVKSSLENIVEKSNLETVNITYNVIAKKCKDDNNCDLNSNNIKDFKYVVSCKSTITAGIDFSKIKIEHAKKNKKLIVTIPDASIKGEPVVGSLKLMNGGDISADELPNVRELCQDTVKTKSSADEKLLPAAKEQARVVLEEFYKQWIKVYDSQYQVEVR